MLHTLLRFIGSCCSLPVPNGILECSGERLIARVQPVRLEEGLRRSLPVFQAARR